jgi:hypothetical protein
LFRQHPPRPGSPRRRLPRLPRSILTADRSSPPSPDRAGTGCRLLQSGPRLVLSAAARRSQPTILVLPDR